MPKWFYRKRKSPDERFWENVDKNGPVPAHCPELGNCWVWTAGGRNPGGKRTPYGKFWINGKTVPAHRAAFFIANGRWADPCTLHRCDGGRYSCVRPDHLFEGTGAENVADCIAKGRKIVKFGNEHHNSKLTESAVIEIRQMNASGKSSEEISKRFGVHPRTVRDVTDGRSWRHVA